MRKHIIWWVSTILILCNIVGCGHGHGDEIQLKHRVMIVYVHSTLHTVSYYSKTYDGQIGLLRGYIDGYREIDDYLVGYLSLRYLKENDLEEYGWENDREGYFIINMKSKKVRSGLSLEQYKIILSEDLKINELPKLKTV